MKPHISIVLRAEAAEQARIGKHFTAGVFQDAVKEIERLQYKLALCAEVMITNDPGNYKRLFEDNQDA